MTHTGGCPSEELVTPTCWVGRSTCAQYAVTRTSFHLLCLLRPGNGHVNLTSPKPSRGGEGGHAAGQREAVSPQTLGPWGFGLSSSQRGALWGLGTEVSPGPESPGKGFNKQTARGSYYFHPLKRSWTPLCSPAGQNLCSTGSQNVFRSLVCCWSYLAAPFRLCKQCDGIWNFVCKGLGVICSDQFCVHRVRNVVGHQEKQG